mmetsp:Transcript_137173/g.293041  ORF Transcript_137173/g.293041 Transcript_137173/m.293041 type:complete len:351 (-) Transcript_137173:42-1094(-)
MEPVADPAMVAATAEGAAAAEGGRKGFRKGKGKGKWWGKGWGGRSQLHTVEESFEVDEQKRYTGKIDYFSKMQGYGFIALEEKEVVPGDRIFVHWQSIDTEDRFPFLCKDMDVEFSIQKTPVRGRATLRAKGVTAPGGGSIVVQDKADEESKEFLGGQEKRYTGVLKFYDPRGGFGYITMDAPEGEVPAELLVDRVEVNSGGRAPQYMEKVKVECGAFKTKSGAIRAYNMTLPGGGPLLKAYFENRKVLQGQKFCGKVTIWNSRQGWGFILSDPSVPLPPEILLKLSEQVKEAQRKAEAKGQKAEEEKEGLLYFRREDLGSGTQVSTDSQVMFQLYTDDKGAGACDVELI